MRKGVIIINAYSRLESSLNQSKRLQKEFDDIGIKVDIIRNNGFYASVASDGSIKSDLVDKYDFCIYLDKDKYISKMLERNGMRLFNSHQAISDCDDKMTTFIQLANNGIPMPETYSGLLCYNPEEPVSAQALDVIQERLGYPLIMKACYGSLGKDIYKINNRCELEKITENMKCKPHLYQRFIDTSIGKDIRVIVVGGKVVASMLRSSDTDFRSNIELGGVGYPYEITENLNQMCVKIASLLNLDYCGIDILFGGDDNYLVCEVNSNAFFGGIEQVTGVNVAKEYAKYISQKIYG